MNKTEPTFTEVINERVKKLNEAQQRAHQKGGEVCAACHGAISNNDFARGLYLYVQSKVSGSIYFCAKCAKEIGGGGTVQ